MYNQNNNKKKKNGEKKLLLSSRPLFSLLRHSALKVLPQNALFGFLDHAGNDLAQADHANGLVVIVDKEQAVHFGVFEAVDDFS